MSEDKVIYDVEQARAAIAAEARGRADACAAEYDALVAELQKRHRCVVIYQPRITPDGRIVARPMVAPQE